METCCPVARQSSITLSDPTTYLLLAVALVDVAAITRAVIRGGGVEATLAWVFAILALPGLGAAAYFLLSGPSVPRTRQRMQQATQSLRETAGVCAAEPLPFPDLAPTENSLLCLATELTGMTPTAANRVESLAADEAAFTRMGAALRAARRFIWAEYYLIRNDDTGHRFLEILAEKAAQGIEVRLIYDAVGSLGLDARRLAAIRAAGGHAEAFLPVNPLRRRWAIHLRNHRKMIVVDGDVGFTGGMNIGDEYSGRARRRGGVHFQDQHLQLRGPAVGDLAQEFAEDWSFTTGELLPLPPRPEPAPGGSAVVAVVPSGPDQEHNATGMVYFAGIASARERIYLTTPYFIPDEPTASALLASAMRGLDVRVLLPAKNDVALVRAAARSYYKRLIGGGVRIFEYQPSVLHTKSMVVDGRWGLVGSANVDVRSFRLNFELSAVVIDQRFAADLEAQFQADLAQSVEITAKDVAAYSTCRKLLDGGARLLSPLL